MLQSCEATSNLSQVKRRRHFILTFKHLNVLNFIFIYLRSLMFQFIQRRSLLWSQDPVNFSTAVRGSASTGDGCRNIKFRKHSKILRTQWISDNCKVLIHYIRNFIQFYCDNKARNKFSQN